MTQIRQGVQLLLFAIASRPKVPLLKTKLDNKSSSNHRFNALVQKYISKTKFACAILLIGTYCSSSIPRKHTDWLSSDSAQHSFRSVPNSFHVDLCVGVAPELKEGKHSEESRHTLKESKSYSRRSPKSNEGHLTEDMETSSTGQLRYQLT
jgi:hypothetical protein